ncbi:aspartate kinase [Candidatus Spongiihabitans sp.]|uniref:aspartate kinase n=1 Tax=Candidatus Spongiihabitans sp. TaxID=3101308 RepID=UPI003C6F8EFD
MTLIVEKYGGTSVGSVERINAVAQNVANSVKSGDRLVVVVSAMSGETNRLIGLAKEVCEQPCPREMDVLTSTGEQVTIALLSLALQQIGISACSYTGYQIPIRTDSVHGKARIEHIDADRVHADLDNGNVVVVAGFQGISEENKITTLGRGGSDTTAVAMAVALHADECRIFTDVDGVYTADPRMVMDARRLESITFEEILELSGAGAKVIQIRAVEFAGKYNVPLRVLSSFEPGPGTLITYEDKNMEQPLISGITVVENEAKITVRGVPDKPGIAYSILGPISAADINVDMIVQNIGTDGLTDFTFTINQEDLQKSMDLLEPVVKELKAETVVGDTNLAKISAVGVGMRSHAGIATAMFRALSEKGINIQMISTSEIKISVTIDKEYTELAVRTLHKAFGLEQIGANR